MKEDQPSRRELFQKILPNERPKEKNRVNGQLPVISRRKFLKYTGATVTSLAANKLKVPFAQANESNYSHIDTTKAQVGDIELKRIKKNSHMSIPLLKVR